MAAAARLLAYASAIAAIPKTIALAAAMRRGADPLASSPAGLSVPPTRQGAL